MRFLIVLTVASLTAEGAFAQNPAARPPVSPFLNLQRPNSSTALNYYDLVRPQVEFRSAIGQLQQQTSAQQQEITGTPAVPGLPLTGHPTGFLTHTRYFQNTFRGGAGGSSPRGGAGTNFGLAASGARSPVAAAPSSVPVR